MKIGFYLLGEKGFKVIDRFISIYGSCCVGFVVLAKDSNVSNDFYNEIKNLIIKNKIKFFEKNEKFTSNADYSFAIGWRWIIDDENLIVFHDSILPKYRGFSPLVNMLINGEECLGVTALKAVSEYDKGPIIAVEKIDILYPVKIQDAISMVSELYIKLVIDITNLIEMGSQLSTIEQNHSDASYSLWRDELDYAIDWSKSSEEIHRFIDAVGQPFKGASTYLNGNKVRIFFAEKYEDVVVEARKENIGKVLFIDKNMPVVVCGQGLLKIHSICDESSSEVINKIPFRSRFCN